MVDELDFMSAIRTWLVSETGESRIYVNGLPKGAVDSKNPAQAATLNQAGGPGLYGERDNLALVQQRIDVICYGETSKEAYDFLRKIAGAFKGLARVVQDTIVLHTAVKSGGAIALIDTQTNVPIVVQSFMITADV